MNLITLWSEWLKPFFNSDFFVAVIGLSAIWVYQRQKADKVREAAKVVLHEVRVAERSIKAGQEAGGKYRTWTKILPTNSWHSVVHMFVGRLSETEVDLIGDFYGKAAFIDRMMSLVPEAKIGAMDSQKNQVAADIDNAPQVAALTGAVQTTAASVSLIYNSPVMEKVREISTKKVWGIF